MSIVELLAAFKMLPFGTLIHTSPDVEIDLIRRSPLFSWRKTLPVAVAVSVSTSPPTGFGVSSTSGCTVSVPIPPPEAIRVMMPPCTRPGLPVAAMMAPCEAMVTAPCVFDTTLSIDRLPATWPTLMVSCALAIRPVVVLVALIRTGAIEVPIEPCTASRSTTVPLTTCPAIPGAWPGALDKIEP